MTYIKRIPVETHALNARDIRIINFFIKRIVDRNKGFFPIRTWMRVCIEKFDPDNNETNAWKRFIERFDKDLKKHATKEEYEKYHEMYYGSLEDEIAKAVIEQVVKERIIEEHRKTLSRYRDPSGLEV